MSCLGIGERNGKMKIEVNVDQRFLFVLAGVLLVTWVFVFVGAYDSDPDAGDPISAGHSTGEVDFTNGRILLGYSGVKSLVPSENKLVVTSDPVWSGAAGHSAAVKGGLYVDGNSRFANELIVNGRLGVGKGPTVKFEVEGSADISQDLVVGGNIKFTNVNVNFNSCAGGSCTVSCDVGEILLGGGCRTTTGPAPFLRESYPTGITWNCVGSGSNSEAYAICLDTVQN